MILIHGLGELLSYSFFPIRFMSFLGIFLSITGFIFGIYIFVERLLSDNYIPGLAPIVILILVLSGFQMLMLGVIGEYLWRTLSQVRNRPKYVINEVIE